MSKKSYIFKGDLVKLIQEQTGLSAKASKIEACRIILEQESLANQIFGFAGGAVYSGLIQNFVEIILDEVNIPRKSVLGRVIANFIENLTFDQIKGYTSGWNDGGCEALMKSIVDVGSESVGEYIIDLIIEKFTMSGAGSLRSEIGIPETGIAAEPLANLFQLDKGSLKDVIAGVIREKIFDIIFTPENRQDIVESICDALSDLDFNLDNISNMIGFGGEEKE
jgi:hypothetical protein